MQSSSTRNRVKTREISREILKNNIHARIQKLLFIAIPEV